MANSVEIDIPLSKFSPFVGIRFRNVYEIAKNTEVDGFQMKIMKEDDKVLAKWDSVEGVDDDELLEKVKQCINTSIEKFKDMKKKYYYNYLISMEHRLIGEMLKEGGKYLKEFRDMLRDKYKLSMPPMIKMMRYDPNMDVQYRAISLEGFCVDLSVNKNGEVKIKRYGECILFKCVLQGPVGIRLTEIEKDIIRLISQTTNDISVMSDEEE
jgi:hypothetical protein